MSSRSTRASTKSATKSSTKADAATASQKKAKKAADKDATNVKTSTKRSKDTPSNDERPSKKAKADAVAVPKSKDHRTAAAKTGKTSGMPSKVSTTRKPPAVIVSESEDEEEDEDDEEKEDDDEEASASDDDDDLQLLDEAAVVKTMFAERPQWAPHSIKKSTSATKGDLSQQEDADELTSDEEASPVSRPVPTWNSDGPTGSDNNDSDGEGDINNNNDIIANTNPTCARCQAPDAVYTAPPSGTRNLSINKQPANAKALIGLAIHHAIGDTIFEDAYPISVVSTRHFRDILLRSARELDLVAFEHRVQHDDGFVDAVSRVLAARISNIRSGVKNTAWPQIQLGYGLEGDGETIKTRVTGMLTTGDYIFPRRGSLICRNKPFSHPVIITVLKEYFFSGTRSILGERYSARYESSSATLPNELELPASMVALCATAVFAGLQDWSSGKAMRTEFKSDTQVDNFRAHMLFMANIKRERPDAYHRMMSDLFNSACSNRTASAAATANNTMAQLDLASMDV